MKKVVIERTVCCTVYKISVNYSGRQIARDSLVVNIPVKLESSTRYFAALIDLCWPTQQRPVSAVLRSQVVPPLRLPQFFGQLVVSHKITPQFHQRLFLLIMVYA